MKANVSRIWGSICWPPWESIARLLPAVVLLLATSPGWSQPIAGPARTVELVFADTEHQALVVGRAMRTGFLVDQLLIPETSYLGRIAWSELSPGVRSAMKDARPGEIHLLTGSTGKLLVARLMPDEPPALLGEARYAQDSKEIWAVLSVGPTDSRLLSMEVDVDTEDLAAICKSKLRLIEGKLRSAQAAADALPRGAAPQELIEAYGDLVSLLSYQGEMAAAIAAAGALVEKLPPQAPSDPISYQDTMHLVLGMLELRRGEVDNCLHHHNREMCLFPLSDAARHRLDDGARKAAGHFTRYLERNPTNLEVRWLLNIAAMTLGRYPDGVPERFRIGPDSFASPVDPGRFWDVAGPAGLAQTTPAAASPTTSTATDCSTSSSPAATPANPCAST